MEKSPGIEDPLITEAVGLVNKTARILVRAAFSTRKTLREIEKQRQKYALESLERPAVKNRIP